MVIKCFIDNYVSVVVGNSSIAIFSHFSRRGFCSINNKENQEVWPVKFRNKAKKQEDVEPSPRIKYTKRRRHGKSRDGWTKEDQREFLRYTIIW